MNKLCKIIKQEFKMTAANKAFVIITIIGPFLLFAVSVLPGLFAMNAGIAPNTQVALIGGDDELFLHLSEALKPANILLTKGKDLETLRSLVLQGELQGILELPNSYLDASSYRYYSKTGTDIAVSQTLGAIVGSIVITKRLTLEGIDAERVAYLSNKPTIETQKLSSSGTSEKQDFGTIIMTAIGFIMIIYMTVLLYGQMIGRSVVMEKISKTVEILLSSVKPKEMLFGKILGKGLAGILQYAIWVAVGLLLIGILGPVFHVQVPSMFSVSSLGFLVVFFILAFFLYSSAYAALGSGADDEQHLGQLAWPLLIFLILPMVMISSIVMNPGSPLVVFMSYFPLTSPLVMFIRVLVDTPPAWEIALCIGILVISIIGMVLLSAKIFRTGILMTGKRAKLGEILKWARY